VFDAVFPLPPPSKQRPAGSVTVTFPAAEGFTVKVHTPPGDSSVLAAPLVTVKSPAVRPLITSLKVAVTANDIELEGRAATNDDVVEFVNNLRRTDYFTNINLQESRAAVENQLNIYQFKLGFRLKG